MRVARVLTNETCNQACAFCSARRPTETREFIVVPAVKKRIDAAVAAGAREVILTGGEPTMRRDLPDLVRFARARGVTRVVLETNAALVTNDLARALASACLEGARLHIPGFGPGADANSRRGGRSAGAPSGLRALGQAGIEIEVAVPIVATNLRLVTAIPGGLRDAGIDVARIIVIAVIDGPDRNSIASVHEAAHAIEKFEESARTHSISLQFNP